MRIRSATSELEAAGEEVDEFAKSSSKLREEIKRITGVDIMLDDSTFKSTYQILEEIAQVYDKLEDVDRANIAEMLFGKRGGNVGMAILDNFEIAQKALDASANSAGSAQEEYDKWANSIEAKLKDLAATWQDFSQDFISSGTIKGAVGALTGLLNVLDAIVNTVGSIPTMAGILGGIMGAKNSGLIIRGNNSRGGLLGSNFGFNWLTKGDMGGLKTWNKWKLVVNSLTANGKDASDALIQMRTAYNNLSPAAQAATLKLDGTDESLAKLKTGGAKAVGVLKNIGMGLLNMGVAMLASFAISKIIEGIDHLVNRVKYAKEAATEAVEEYQTSVSELDEIKERLDEIGARILQINREGLTLSNAEELAALQLENEELEKRLALQKAIVKEKNREAQNDLKKAFDEEYNRPVFVMHGGSTMAPKNLSPLAETNKNIEQYRTSGDETLFSELLADAQSLQGYIEQGEAIGLDVSDETYKSWVDLRNLILEVLGIINDEDALTPKEILADKLSNPSITAVNYLKGLSASDVAGGAGGDYYNYLVGFAERFGASEQELREVLVDLGVLTDEINFNSFASSADAAATAVAKLTSNADLLTTSADKIASLTDTDFDEILKAFPQLSDEIEAFSEGQISATELQEEFNKVLEDFNAKEVADAFDSLIDVYESYGDGSSQVEEALEELEALIPGVTDALYDEHGELRAGADAAFGSRDALEQFIAAMIETQLVQAQANYETLKSQLAEVGQEAVNAAGNLVAFWQTMQGNFTGYLEHRPAASASGGGGGGGSKSIYSKEYEAASELADHYIELSELTQKRMKEGSDAWMDEQQKQYAYTHKKAELIKGELDRLSAKGYDETSEEFAKLRREYEKAQNDLYDVAESAWEAQRDSQINALKQQKDAIEDLKDAEEKRWKEREEQLNYEIDVQEALISALKTYNELRKSFRAERADLEGQLALAKANAASFDGTNIADSLFSEADYKDLTAKLDAISKEADALYEDVLVQINSVTKDNVEELELITSAFERQYDLKLKEYEVAKQELAVARARKELENVQNERNVAMLVNGVWTWVADPEAVRSAVEAVNEAEADSIEAITDLADAQREAILQDALDGIEKQKILEEAAHEKIMEAYEEQLELLEKQIELLENMEFVFEEFIRTFAEGMEGIAGAISNAIAAIASAGGSGKSGSSNPAKPNKKKSTVTYTRGPGIQTYTRYASGGVANETGLAYLDGTAANPEVVFNSKDAAKLYSLVHDTPDLVASFLGNVMPLAVAAPGIPKLLGGANTSTDNSRTVYIGELKLDEKDSSSIVSVLERVIPSFGY